MKKARVIVTLDCVRQCEKCCNTEEVFNQHRIVTDIKELLDYDMIMITGGEPMLIPSKVYQFIGELKELGYKGKFYMYSAHYTESLAGVFSIIMRHLDGMQFTLHESATWEEVYQLKQLSEQLKYYHDKTLRLSIDKRLYDKYDFSNIDFSAWSVVRKLVWLDNCPLPPDEELLIYKL